MASLLDDLPTLTALVEIARDFHRRGWMAGTAGNLSARTTTGRFCITASGKPKGRLDEGDFVEIDIATGAVAQRHEPRAQPSAEAAIHRALYRLFPRARACLHVHTVDATLAALAAPPDAVELPLPSMEMVKGLGIWEQDPKVALALFDNLADVAAIADEVEARFTAHTPRMPALMIRHHGVTVWGDGIQQAYDRLECLEFVLGVAARASAAT
ncbi:MAG: methylthioribulose 1-phosphate dehydratase [Gammaproteobacteria bacterium]